MGVAGAYTDSLAYLGAFTRPPGGSNADEDAATAVTVGMLRLTLDTSPTTVRDVQARLDELAGEAASPEAAPTRALLAELLPVTDRLLKALSIASLILFGLLAQMDLQLWARARALQRRAALEHAIAQFSMYLLTARPGEVGAYVGRALGDLATGVDADRAYFLSSDAVSRRITWCRPGTVFPAGWPDRASTMAAHFHPTAAGLVHVPCVDRLTSGPAR